MILWGGGASQEIVKPVEEIDGTMILLGGAVGTEEGRERGGGGGGGEEERVSHQYFCIVPYHLPELGWSCTIPGFWVISLLIKLLMH